MREDELELDAALPAHGHARLGAGSARRIPRARLDARTTMSGSDFVEDVVRCATTESLVRPLFTEPANVGFAERADLGNTERRHTQHEAEGFLFEASPKPLDERNASVAPQSSDVGRAE